MSKLKATCLHLDEAVIHKLKKYALKNRITMSVLASYALEKFFKENPDVEIWKDSVFNGTQADNDATNDVGPATGRGETS